MTGEIKALIITAATIGFFHTLLGPDHYLPFVMMSWARKWSHLKTGLITFLCGIGHVGSSVVLGLLGVGLGLVVGRLEAFESVRGTVAAWLLIGFGLAYFIWGLRGAYKKRPHTHAHFHVADNNHVHEARHEHEHAHEGGHIHVHDRGEPANITPWVLFVVFAFGPCEPLIPILMYPAAKSSMTGLIAVTLVFSVATIGTMLATVFLGRAGVRFMNVKFLQRYSHAIAGATILLCGLAMQFLGL
jgi:ABC-type nickel/cobalt efflux system permease component RcnA